MIKITENAIEFKDILSSACLCSAVARVNLTILRKSLLPKLMSGEVWVNHNKELS